MKSLKSLRPGQLPTIASGEHPQPWDLKTPGLLERVAVEAALVTTEWEAAGFPEACPACGGAGWVWDCAVALMGTEHEKQVDCGACHGTGIAR